MSGNPFEVGTDKVEKVAMEKPKSADNMGAVAQAPLEKTTVETIDASIKITKDSISMVAYASAEAPQGDGKDITVDSVRKALQDAGITYGLDEEAIQEMGAPTYHKNFTVARGLVPEDGVDGACIELFPRKFEPTFQERADGSVDYRELGLINDVRAGTPICTVTEPTSGKEGYNVLGKLLKPIPGKKAVLPMGEGTVLSPDGSRVEAVYSGNLVFRNGRFTIDRVFRVETVNFDVGNITFSGDVIVNGDVQDGFEIHSGGDVTLRGRVGNIVVQANNITIEQGINGTGKAQIDAVHTIKAGFIENCNMRAGDKIIASSIINSQIECEGTVEVTAGKGIICGGKITAFGSIKANVVGNEFNTLTLIVLGITPRLIKERKKLQETLHDVVRHLDELTKNVAYIERLVADGRPVPPDRIQFLQRTKFQLPLTTQKKEQLELELLALEEKMLNVNSSALTARSIYPPTRISIGALSINCIEVRHACRVYKNKEGDLVFGMA